MELSELFAGREAELASMRSRLETFMDEEGLPYGDRTRTANSRRAQELARWAESRSEARSEPDGQPESSPAPLHPIHDALFRAYFVDGKNLAEPDVLVEVAESVGLSEEEVRKALEQRPFREEIDRHWERSRKLGIPGVPAFVAGRRYAVGAQPYEVLEDLVRQAGAVPQSPERSRLHNGLLNDEPRGLAAGHRLCSWLRGLLAGGKWLCLPLTAMVFGGTWPCQLRRKLTGGRHRGSSVGHDGPRAGPGRAGSR